jgi:hypothetical protein
LIEANERIQSVINAGKRPSSKLAAALLPGELERSKSMFETVTDVASDTKWTQNALDRRERRGYHMR